MIVISDTSAITSLLQTGESLQRVAGFRVSMELKARLLAEAGE
jgi:hypothetical protein